jgi:hypothetical protein
MPGKRCAKKGQGPPVIEVSSGEQPTDPARTAPAIQLATGIGGAEENREGVGEKIA